MKKFICSNIVPLAFILLAGFLAYLDKSYGWCIFCAVITTSNK